MKREVGAQIEAEITAPTTLEFQVAVAPHPRTEVFESLRFVLNGRPVQPSEIRGLHGNRIHHFDARVGTLKVHYWQAFLDRGPDRAQHAGRHGDR